QGRPETRIRRVRDKRPGRLRCSDRPASGEPPPAPGRGAANDRAGEQETAVVKSLKPVLGGRETVRVAIPQFSWVFLDREASIDRAIEAIREAGQNGADLVVFSEVWLTGYPYWTEGWDTDLKKWVGGRVAFRDAAVLIPSEDTERLGQAARQAGVYLA